MMEKGFDDLLAKKMRGAFLDLEAPYDEGAWERFLERKKSKKRVIFWLGASVAVSIVLAICFDPLYQLTIFPKPIAPIIQNEKIIPPASQLQPREELIDVKDEQWVSNSLRLAYEKVPSRKANIHRQTIAFETESDNLHKTTSETDHADIHSIPDSLKQTDSNLADLFADSTYLALENDKEGNKQLLFGVILASGIGVDNSSQGLTGAMSYNGGVSFELPIADRLSIGTGLVVNYMSTDRESTSFVGDLNNPDKREDAFHSEYFNLGIPIQLVYTLNERKDNLFALIGINSYYSVKQQTHVNSTTTRDVHVFSGDGEPMIVTETFGSSETIRGEGNELLPAATLDLALSYRLFQSEGLVYEIRPFYRHPISSITGDGTRVPMGGVAIRLLFKQGE